MSQTTIIISKQTHKELRRISVEEETPLYHITEELFEKFIKDWKKQNKIGCN